MSNCVSVTHNAIDCSTANIPANQWCSACRINHTPKPKRATRKADCQHDWRITLGGWECRKCGALRGTMP